MISSSNGVLIWDVSVKYCMQSVVAMGRASKTSALEQMEQNEKVISAVISATNMLVIFSASYFVFLEY